MSTTNDAVEHWRYREPYLPKFFGIASKRMQLSRDHRLLDIACGTGQVSFGFAPFVGSITGIDIDQQALAIARREAQERNIRSELSCVGIADFVHEGPPFDLVTIGRARAYLPRQATLARLETLVSPQGSVLICGSMTEDNLSGPWARAFRATGRGWGRRMPALRANEFMSGSNFRFEDSIIVRDTRSITVEDVLHRALAYSRLTAEALGPRKDQYLEDIRSAIAPFAVDGMLSETIQMTGFIFRPQ